MWITKEDPVYAFFVVIGILFFVFTVVAFLDLFTSFLGAVWWSNFSLFANILAAITIIYTFYLGVTGRIVPNSPSDIAVAVVDEMELRERYRSLKEVPGSDEVPEEVDYGFTQHRLARVSSALRDSGFSENALEFEAVGQLVSNGHLTDALIRTRRAIETLFWSILRHSGEMFRVRRTVKSREKWGERYFTFNQLIDKLESLRLLTTQERTELDDFWIVGSRSTHQVWTPTDEASIVYLSMIAGIVEILIQRYADKRYADRQRYRMVE